MARPELAEFQRATVDRICERLGDPNGSHRFLLADEVGLGKTIVARGVIERLLERRRTPLIVVYLCSNAEIAEQNRRKLDPRAGRPLRRLSEIALRSGEKAGELQLFSFTPGTSLHDGTGLAWERRLLLFLMGRVQDRDVNQRRWREFFRCGVHEDRWYPDTRPGGLEDEFRRKITVEFQQKLGEDWRRPIELDGERIVLSRSLDEEVDRFASGADSVEVRRRRNRLVAVLRKGLQRVALDYLEPDLVILDEVQRFKEVLDEEQDSHSEREQKSPVTRRPPTPGAEPGGSGEVAARARRPQRPRSKVAARRPMACNWRTIRSSLRMLRFQSLQSAACSGVSWAVTVLPATLRVQMSYGP